MHSVNPAWLLHDLLSLFFGGWLSQHPLNQPQQPFQNSALFSHSFTCFLLSLTEVNILRANLYSFLYAVFRLNLSTPPKKCTRVCKSTLVTPVHLSRYGKVRWGGWVTLNPQESVKLESHRLAQSDLPLVLLLSLENEIIAK